MHAHEDPRGDGHRPGLNKGAVHPAIAAGLPWQDQDLVTGKDFHGLHEDAHLDVLVPGRDTVHLPGTQDHRGDVRLPPSIQEGHHLVHFVHDLTEVLPAHRQGNSVHHVGGKTGTGLTPLP